MGGIEVRGRGQDCNTLLPNATPKVLAGGKIKTRAIGRLASDLAERLTTSARIFGRKLRNRRAGPKISAYQMARGSPGSFDESICWAMWTSS